MKTNKQLSVLQELWVASFLDGRRTKASGAAKHDPGDVISPDYVAECKVTRGKSLSVKKEEWKKIRNEAHTGRDPLMAFRFVDENDKSEHDLFLVDANHFLEMRDKLSGIF